MRLLEKRPLTGKFSKFCYDSLHRDTNRRDVCKFHEIWQTGNGRNCALLTGQKS